MNAQDLADALFLLDPAMRGRSAQPSQAAIEFKKQVLLLMPGGVVREWENVRPYVYFLVERKQATDDLDVSPEELDAAFVTHAIRRQLPSPTRTNAR